MQPKLYHLKNIKLLLLNIILLKQSAQTNLINNSISSFINNRIITLMFLYYTIHLQNKCIKTFLHFLTRKMLINNIKKKIRQWIWKMKLKLNRKIFNIMKYLMRHFLDLFCKYGKEIWILLLILKKRYTRNQNKIIH